MNKIFYRIIAAFLGLMSLGSMSETYRIMTSDAPDIAPQRTFLSIMAILLLIGLLLATRYFWNKSK